MEPETTCINTDPSELLTNEGYFTRFRELAQEMTVLAAWEHLESEMPFGIRRYTSYTAFLAAKKREAKGRLGCVIYLKILVTR